MSLAAAVLRRDVEGVWVLVARPSCSLLGFVPSLLDTNTNFFSLDYQLTDKCNTSTIQVQVSSNQGNAG